MRDANKKSSAGDAKQRVKHEIFVAMPQVHSTQAARGDIIPQRALSPWACCSRIYASRSIVMRDANKNDTLQPERCHQDQVNFASTTSQGKTNQSCFRSRTDWPSLKAAWKILRIWLSLSLIRRNSILLVSRAISLIGCSMVARVG